ncbi:MAG: ATP-dependent Clp protease proteolytic subunit, partial [Actinobacteria bacterium]|nr:ATP-dependent Clp protease proteolytic subunit [Actinomycetota bacterium]
MPTARTPASVSSSLRSCACAVSEQRASGAKSAGVGGYGHSQRRSGATTERCDYRGEQVTTPLARTAVQVRTAVQARTTEAPVQPLGDQLFQRLLRHRIIFLGQQVDDDLANRICAELILLA